MPITLEQAKNVTWNDSFEHDTLKNADGTPMRFRLNGAVKTWVRDTSRIRIPVKHGLYDYGVITNGTNEGNQFTLDISEISLV